MSAQLDNFAKTRQDIITMIGAAAAEELLKNALFLVAIGSNDLITNYLLLPLLKPPPEVFVGNMVSAFRLQLTVKPRLIILSFLILLSFCFPLFYGKMIKSSLIPKLIYQIIRYANK